jgi:hypothetical protein
LLFQIPGSSARRPFKRGAITYFLLIFGLIFLVTACRRNTAQQWGDQALLSGSTVLDCSEECAARGQCGNSAERGRVVLLSRWGPATHNHDLAITAGTAVTVLSTEATFLEQAMGGELLLTYYLVEVPERGPGWVAGWCLRAP